MKKLVVTVIVAAICLIAVSSVLYAEEKMGEMSEHHHHGKMAPIKDDPTIVAGNVYKMLFENEKVRVCDVNFKPGETAKMHSHPDHVAYALTDGKLSITNAGSKPMEVEIKAGQAMWMPAVTHEATNVGKTDMHLIVMELKGSNMAMEMKEHEKMEKMEKMDK